MTQPTRRIPDRADVLKELANVTDELDTGSATSEARLALLRRQAQLGDLRDAIAQRERRAQAPR